MRLKLSGCGARSNGKGGISIAAAVAKASALLALASLSKRPLLAQQVAPPRYLTFGLFIASIEEGADRSFPLGE